MHSFKYRIVIVAEDVAGSGSGAKALTDILMQVDGVLQVEREKVDPASMDLGTIVTAIAASGATLAIARGIAAWLQARRGASITIERDGATGSIRAAVAGIDPSLVVRIAEIVRG